MTREQVKQLIETMPLRQLVYAIELYEDAVEKGDFNK